MLPMYFDWPLRSLLGLSAATKAGHIPAFVGLPYRPLAFNATDSIPLHQLSIVPVKAFFD